MTYKKQAEAADIADNTILDLEINANAAIADSKLNLTTTVSGTAISSSNPIIDATASLVDRPTGMVIYPWSNNQRQYNASVVRFVRFMATRPLVIKRMGFRVTIAGSGGSNSGADTVDLGIYYDANQSSTASNWTLAASSGPVNGSSSGSPIYNSPTSTTLTTLASATNKYVVLSSPYTLVPGKVYFAAFSYTVPTPTANTTHPQIAEFSAPAGDLLSSTVPGLEAASQVVAGLPSTMGSAGIAAAMPLIVLSTA